ncbi:MAG: hypothetical protein PHP25_01610 [Candidatus Moranbacteria bacterium]|nr:hypothetical protein [Candidatus Moranbacteria bacterium]
MASDLEKIQEATPKTRHNFKESIIELIISKAIPKILANCSGKDTIDDRDIAGVIGPMLDGYNQSDTDFTKRMLNIKNYEDWDVFCDEVQNAVARKARERRRGSDAFIPDGKSEVAGRKLYRGETKMMNKLLGEASSELRKKNLTTKDYDFGKVSQEIINKILNRHEVEKITDSSAREQMRRQMTAIINKSFTPESLAEYNQKLGRLGKKYTGEERKKLFQTIEETVERVSLMMENMNLDADENLKTSEKIIPSDFSRKDVRKIRILIKSTLARALKNNLNSDNQESYIRDLVPLILDSLKERPQNPVETILKRLYEK